MTGTPVALDARQVCSRGEGWLGQSCVWLGALRPHCHRLRKRDRELAEGRASRHASCVIHA